MKEDTAKDELNLDAILDEEDSSSSNDGKKAADDKDATGNQDKDR